MVPFPPLKGATVNNQSRIPARPWPFAPLILAALLALAAAIALLPRGVAAQTNPEKPGNKIVYLPFLRSGGSSAPASSGCDVPAASYITMPIASSPSDRPAAEHPDINLAVRGWVSSSYPLQLVSYGPTEDAKAPQFDDMFADRRLPVFTSSRNVNSWDWSSMSKRPPTEPYTTLLGLKTTPNEVIGAPDSGYDIGGGYDALVLYAAPTRITLKYTREDNVIAGYTVHIENLCVEPDLLALYNQANAAGRGNLPAVRGGQALGRAAGSELLVAIRDTGTFLDPRSRYDWWAGH
jgi:hypothetical protein